MDINKRIEESSGILTSFEHKDIPDELREDWKQEMLLILILLHNKFESGDFNKLLAKTLTYRRVDFIEKYTSEVRTDEEVCKDVVYIKDLSKVDKARGKLTEKQKKMFDMLMEGYIMEDVIDEFEIKQSAYSRMLNRIIGRIKE